MVASALWSRAKTHVLTCRLVPEQGAVSPQMIGGAARVVRARGKSLGPCLSLYKLGQLKDLIRVPKGNQCIIGFNPRGSRGVVGIKSIIVFFHGDY